ncbi:phenylalanine--tRNA ligase subunit beta [Paraferrimonas sedimenticola]|uniref:Phenylalanine--tRNA ligase beta subunit n=1 Tax=Paraferrimonas sedimenticola TaxID=375674 RepID=A0AA37RXT2_9GAMM|nr:phenylalanine--tRNA ligase subunit beta [Paraferrimonas sedimenticola]GLP96547.1 phenylalanine--tRNA ligase beta subunit [Paraferrimonas sedimenticola]
MKFSESWLREWVNPSIDSQALAEQITMAGLEVDEVAPVAGDFSGVVVGEVVECGQHPDADKLRVTKVNVGGEELLDIVCGASNCRLGLKVAVAVVGAVLPGNFKIKKAKLRGQPSHGMLCSFGELGIDVESDGIIELPADAPIGTEIRDYLKLDDGAIDVDLTTNRADCLGMLGLAREVATLNRLPFNELSIEAAPVTIDDKPQVKLTDAEACPKYLGRTIKGVNVKAQSPLWMQEKLRRGGIRSIDPIVDITNYVLLELGQPMHAFDAAKVEGTIDARYAKAGEKLTLLDGNEAELREDTLVIADDKQALAMAGIFGGEFSGVTTETQDIILECAFFNKLAIMGKARSYGLHTDSSHRFERGVDPQLQTKAMERATNLILEICGGQAGPITLAEQAEHLPQSATIELRRSKLDKLLGHVIPSEDVEAILKGLGFEVEAGDDSWQAKAPSYRFDMAIEEDLIEEVARVYGYNNIPNQAPSADLVMPVHQEAQRPLSRVRDVLIDRGYQEAITYSFVDPKLQALLHPEQEALVLPNPISADMSAMRLSLWTGLLGAVAYNQKRQQGRVRLFETGLRFIPDASIDVGVTQEPMIAAVIAGNSHDEHWSIDSQAVDFFDIKGDLEAILDVSADELSFEFVAGTHKGLHPGQSAQLLRNGQAVGWIGAVHPNLNKAFGLNGKAFVFEVAQEALLQAKLPEAQPVSKFPSNRRDIAVVLDDTISAQSVLNTIRKVGGNQLVGINLFDVYQGEGVAEGKKSLAIALTLQDVTRTLEDKDITQVVEAVVSSLQSEFNASLRD